MIKTVVCKAPRDTLAFGRKIGEEIEKGTIIALYGTLGAGKTVLTQGLALGLGIEKPVTSPTYALLQTYSGGRLLLNHFDLYRLETPEQVMAIGFEDAVYSNAVSVVEWPERLGDMLPVPRLDIYIERLDGNERSICVREIK